MQTLRNAFRRAVGMHNNKVPNVPRRWSASSTGRRTLSSSARGPGPSSSAAVVAGVGSALSAGFLCSLAANTNKPALADGEGRGWRGGNKARKVCTCLFF